MRSLPVEASTAGECSFSVTQCLAFIFNLNIRHVLSGIVKNRKYLTFVIKAVRYFVANHNTNAAVIQRFREMLAVEKWLQNASRENWKNTHLFS